jgi:hypothetical protein
MTRIRQLLLCALALGLILPAALLAASTAPAAVSHHPAVGIGDEKPDLFKDPRFRALRIKNVRYDMAWDALSVPSQRAAVISWMKAAKKDGLNVLVTIDHSKRVIYKKVKVHGKTKKKAFSQVRVLPSSAQYNKAFKAFRKLFPWVTEFATWDETNCFCEVTFNKERQVAAFYRGLRLACSRCTILAAEFLDVNKHEAVPMPTWVAQLDKALGYQPGYWGLNDYEDANHFISTGARQLLSLVRGKIWLAETGGIVNRRGIKNPGFPQNATHAAKADGYVLKTLGSLSPRIQHIYLYEWDAKTRHDNWDSALISYNNIPRPGYKVLAKTLSSWGIKPNCKLSRVPPTCGKG